MTAATSATIEHVIGERGSFALHVRSNDVRILAVDGDTVRLRARDGRDLRRVDAERGPGLLAVRASSGADDLDVEVPRAATVVVEGSSGDIVVHGLRAEQRYRTSSGDIELDGVGGQLTAEAVSGDVRIVAAEPVDVSARSVSGDLSLQAGEISAMRAVTTSGDLRLAGHFEGDGPFTIETVSGDAVLAPAGDLGVTVTTITGDVRADVDARQEGPRGRRRISIGAGTPALAFRSTSGDLRIGRAVPLPARTTDRSALRAPGAPTPPAPPEPPTPEEATMTTDHTAERGAADPAATPELDILHALERGDIDVAEASRRLAELADDPDTHDIEAGRVR